MLEALLKHFRSYGMEDLEFIIVNSKLSHSQDKLHELTKRVSFEVYQETDEEEVWSVMEGGKDDMFVYDRCGRLTYYVPFPLSILNESPLVSNAILATYFRSPCGDSCDQNKTIEVDDVVKNIEGDYDSSNVTDQYNSTDTETEDPIYKNGITDETQFANDLFHITAPENNETDTLNSNSTQNFTDYEFPTYDSSLEINETNTTNVDRAKSFFTDIYRLFFHDRNNDGKVAENVNFNSNSNETSSDESNHQNMKHDGTRSEITSSQVHHTNHRHHKETDNQGKKKSDRCLEADYEVCKSWSKKRLLHAQRCCSEIHSDSGSQRSCHNFGKKRCKKMQSILKCCIKTAYTEPAATVPTDEETATINEESATVTPMSTDEFTTLPSSDEKAARREVADVVCCKTIGSAKLCRVSYSEACEEGEYVENSPSRDM